MDVTDRLGSDHDDVSAVSREAVLRYWLAEEAAEDDGDLAVDTIDDEAVLLDELIERKPLAESVFAERALEWYHVELDEEELRALRVVPGPSGEGWRSVAENGRIESVAEKIHEADDLDWLNEATEKDVEKVRSIAQNLQTQEAMEELIVVGDREDPPWIADGNHRAVARVLHAIEREEYTEQIAYVGVDPERFDR